MYRLAPDPKWSAEDLLTYIRQMNAPAEIQSVFTSNLHFSISDTHPIEQLSHHERRVVLDTLKSEHREKELEDYTYLFTRSFPRDLPRSAWEDPSQRINSPEAELLFDTIQKIRDLEQKIITTSFDPDAPLLITAVGEGRYVIDAGHHRLQVVRNLMRKGKIPADFKTPLIVRFEKRRFEYKKIDFQGITDYSYSLYILLQSKQAPPVFLWFQKGRDRILIWARRDISGIHLKLSPLRDPNITKSAIEYLRIRIPKHIPLYGAYHYPAERALFEMLVSQGILVKFYPWEKESWETGLMANSDSNSFIDVKFNSETEVDVVNASLLLMQDNWEMRYETEPAPLKFPEILETLNREKSFCRIPYETKMLRAVVTSINLEIDRINDAIQFELKHMEQKEDWNTALRDKKALIAFKQRLINALPEQDRAPLLVLG